MFSKEITIHKLLRVLIILVVFIYVAANSTLVVAAAVLNVVEHEANEDILAVLPESIPEITLITTPILFSEFDYVVTYDITSNNDLSMVINSALLQLNDAISSGAYTAAACESMTQEALRLKDIVTKLELNIVKIASWETEYYYAAKTWEYFISRGYNEAVISAIIGNMMVETAGGTLNLRPNAYSASGNYYGLCQWSLSNRPGLANLSFEKQLEYLESDLASQFNTFGKRYYSGFNYESFLSMDDPAKAAIAFAKVYERCASFSYAKRERAAIKAYDYFNID